MTLLRAQNYIIQVCVKFWIGELTKLDNLMLLRIADDECIAFLNYRQSINSDCRKWNIPAV